MSITHSRIDSTPSLRAYATVAVAGDLDRAGIARLRAELAGWRAAGAIEVHLDLSGVTSHDPGLARVLAWAQSQLHGAGATLVLTGASTPLRAELDDAVAALEALPGWHPESSDRIDYRPETADQP